MLLRSDMAYWRDHNVPLFQDHGGTDIINQ